VYPSHVFADHVITAFNLTTWGYNFVGVDPKDGSYGGMFSKLLLRELPHYFKSGSGHSHFPYVHLWS
jgi:linoleate 10R-lipoxygenase